MLMLTSKECINCIMFQAAMGCIAAGLSIAMATLFTTEYTGKPGFFVWICLIYFFFCGIWAVVPATLAKMFGSSNMAINYGFIDLAVVSSVYTSDNDLQQTGFGSFLILHEECSVNQDWLYIYYFLFSY